MALAREWPRGCGWTGTDLPFFLNPAEGGARRGAARGSRKIRAGGRHGGHQRHGRRRLAPRHVWRTIFGFGGLDTLRGSGGADTLFGGGGADTLFGGEGNDSLLGKGGADTLAGGFGLDALTGGAGVDRLRGGGDGDQFVFLAPSDGSAVATNVVSTATGDIVLDFTTGQDVLLFNASDFGLNVLDPIEEGTNFATIDPAYSGTLDLGLSSNFDIDQATFVFSTETNTLYHDANGDQAGYTVVATFESGTVGAVDIGLMAI